MQMIVEGLAIAAFNVMRKQTGYPTCSAQLLDYVLQDEGRHVNFGYFALRRSIPNMEAAKRDTSRTSPSRRATTCTRATTGRAFSR